MDSELPVLKTIHAHRSVRKFDPNITIDSEKIRSIIAAGQQASTSCTGQMYTIIEITRSRREEIAPLCGDQQFVKDASYFCVICLDLNRLRRLVELSGGENPNWDFASILIGTFDAGLMAQNMVLAAEAMGFDVCFCGSCGDQPKKMIEALDLPDHVLPLTGLAIGKGLEYPPVRPRLPMNLVNFVDQYTTPSDEELNAGISKMSQALVKEGYYQKYGERPSNYSWSDHLRNKFGGKWLAKVEKRRIEAAREQGFLDSNI